jgi:hypothetical protein
MKAKADFVRDWGLDVCTDPIDKKIEEFQKQIDGLSAIKKLV